MDTWAGLLRELLLKELFDGSGVNAVGGCAPQLAGDVIADVRLDSVGAVCAVAACLRPQACQLVDGGFCSLGEVSGGEELPELDVVPVDGLLPCCGITPDALAPVICITFERGFMAPPVSAVDLGAI